MVVCSMYWPLLCFLIIVQWHHTVHSLHPTPILNPLKTSSILRPQQYIPPINIALTRARGSNDYIRRLLTEQLAVGQFNITEVPCIGFSSGPDMSQLAAEIETADGVLLTSPRVCDKLMIIC